jgi:FkbM family methyltransferase
VIRPADWIAESLATHRVHVIDVGARGGWPPKWVPFRDWVTMIGFEPDPEEFAQLDRRAGPHEIVLPAALSRAEGEAVLHVTRNPFCSSLYPPNHELVEQLRPGDRQLEVVGEEPISVESLDSALGRAGIDRADFIKLDTQGAELDILAGAPRTLSGGVLAVEVEVQFLPLYQGVGLFGDVDAMLRRAGFSLAGFPNLCTVADFAAAHDGQPVPSIAARARRWLRHLAAPLGKLSGEQQLLWGDAIYLRPPEWGIAHRGPGAAPQRVQLARSVLISSVLRYFQHATACIRAVEADGSIDPQQREDLEEFVRMIAKARLGRGRGVRSGLRRLLEGVAVPRA